METKQQSPIDWQQPAKQVAQFINEQYQQSAPAFSLFNDKKLNFLRVVYPKGSEELRKPKGTPGDLFVNWSGHPSTFIVCGDQMPLHVTHLEYDGELLTGTALKAWVEKEGTIPLLRISDALQPQ